VRLRRGIKAWGKYLARHLEVGGRAAWGGRRQREKAAGVDQRGGEDTTDKQGPLDRETRERRPSQETRPTRGLDGTAGMVSACMDSAVGGLAWPEAERAARLARPKARKNNFQIKIGFLNLPRLWKFVEGDLGGILT
jgi:hypothetical protein